MEFTKKRVDTGIRGNPSTGDVLADGGNKINVVIDSLYNTFGDERLYKLNNGIDIQTLHATGYYQKHDRSYYGRAVEMGSRHDIDVTTGPITIRLPKLKLGEGIEIINSNGSMSDQNYVNLICESNDSFADGTNSKIFRSPYSKILVWGRSEFSGRGTWDYSLENLYSKDYTPVELDEFINTTENIFTISHIDDYRVIKFLVYFFDALDQNSKSSEVVLHINKSIGEVFFTEYAVIGNNPDDLYTLDFFIDGDLVKMNVRSKLGNNSRFMMKSIEIL